MDLEALRRRLHRAPRPLKKRSSITDPEGPAGPAVQKLLYQKTTLAAMETVPVDTVGAGPQAVEDGQPLDESVTPPPRSPAPDPAPCRSLPPPLEVREGGARPCPGLHPPPPSLTCGEGEHRDDVMAPPPPEVTGQVPPVSLQV